MGYSTDPSSLLKFSSAQGDTNNENLTESMMGCPPTALMKVFDKFCSIKGFKNNSTSRDDFVGNLYSGGLREKASQILASQLQSKIGKISKLENKLMALNSELASDLVNWASNIPNYESEKMVKSFGVLLAAQKDSDAIVHEKLNKLKLNLSYVNEREKKQNDLITSKNKLFKQLKDSEARHGPNSSTTTLLRERLEENVCNLGVVEIQYIRSIARNLKEALIDYLFALQSTSATLNEATNEYYEILLSLETEANRQHTKRESLGSRKNPHSSASPYGNVAKSPSDLDIEHGHAGSRVDSLVLADNKSYGVCSDCMKPTHANGSRIPTRGAQGSRHSEIPNGRPPVHPASPTKIRQDNLHFQGFEFKENYGSNENWA